MKSTKSSRISEIIEELEKNVETTLERSILFQSYFYLEYLRF
jgi:hypothetical protein